MNMNYKVGDVVRMKKTHPCGGREWEVLRTGIDFKMRCLVCGRLVMLPRAKFEKGVREVISEGPSPLPPV